MTAYVAETVTFTLVPGVSVADYVALSQASETFIAAQPGFVRRHLCRGEDGRWCDTAIWESMEAAKATADAFLKQDFAPALMAAIQPDSVEMRHDIIHWSHGAA